MENEAVVERVRNLLAEALSLSLEKITPALAFGDVKEWDSMGHMSIMMLLEEKLGIEIDADAIGTLTSIPDICAYIEKKE
jgi:citrate synthase